MLLDTEEEETGLNYKATCCIVSVRSTHAKPETKKTWREVQGQYIRFVTLENEDYLGSLHPAQRKDLKTK